MHILRKFLSASMNKSKILVCVDFDHTVVDCNTDVQIKSLAGANGLPDEIECLSDVPNGWTTYMRELFKFLFKNKVTKEDYMQCLSKLPLVNGMKELFLQLHRSEVCDIIILSDANSFFIEYVLQCHGFNYVFSNIFTNHAEFDERGCLCITEFQEQDSCTKCSRNLCKGSILENYVLKNLSGNTHFYKVVYIGDGHNDICPSLRLSSNDCIFARKGYRLLKTLKKMPPEKIKAVVIPWETGYDIRNKLLLSE